MSSQTLRRLSGTVFLLLAALGAPAALAAADSAAGAPLNDPWPRQFVTAQGSTVTVYQPQIDTLKAAVVTGRAALSVVRKGESAAHFGVATLAAHVTVDRDANLVSLSAVKVERVRFPHISAEQEQRFAVVLQQELPAWQLAMSYDRFRENLRVADRERQSAEGLRHDPPAVVFAEEPTILLAFDGTPVFKDVTAEGLAVAVNTPLLVVQDRRSGRCYLAGGQRWWYQAADPRGPWQWIGSPPPEIAALAARQRAAAGAADTAAPDDGTAQAAPPRIAVATTPTELVVSTGKPSFSPLPGADLLYMDNSERDVLLDIPSQQYYVLLAGRWYRGAALATGSWEYVPPAALPSSFASIPPDSPVGDALASVPGTDEAEDAELDAQIPQTTAVRRGAAPLVVTYDGAPDFLPIAGTSVSYAANASTPVLLIDDRYYACDNAVWYVAAAPAGPWEIATTLPREQIDAIPPSAPVYNVKFVDIYDVTPEVVWTGYTAGYLGWYPWHGTVVWGTGWIYPPWEGAVYCWPWPWTWGLGAYWNPWGGWGFGISWDGPFFDLALGWGPWFRPIGWAGRPGGWHRGWWGPGGYRPRQFGSGGAARPGSPGGTAHPTGAAASSARAAGRNPIRFQPPVGGAARPAPARPYDRLPPGVRATPTPAQPPHPATGRPNDVYGGPNGEVFRRTPSGDWQQHDGSGWVPAPRAPANQPGLDRDYGARQRGATRAGGHAGGHPGGHGH